MWIRHPQTHVLVLVLDEAHITRLLAEGGTEEAAPPASVPAPSPVVAAPAKEKATTGPTRPKKGR